MKYFATDRDKNLVWKYFLEWYPVLYSQCGPFKECNIYFLRPHKGVQCISKGYAIINHSWTWSKIFTIMRKTSEWQKAWTFVKKNINISDCFKCFCHTLTFFFSSTMRVSKWASLMVCSYLKVEKKSRHNFFVISISN